MEATGEGVKFSTADYTRHIGNSRAQREVYERMEGAFRQQILPKQGKHLLEQLHN